MTISICTNCHLAAQGFDAHDLGYTPPVQPLRLIEHPLLLVPNVDMESEVSAWGDGHFSPHPCQGCGYTLGGQRLKYLMLEITVKEAAMD